PAIPKSVAFYLLFNTLSSNLSIICGLLWHLFTCVFHNRWRCIQPRCLTSACFMVCQTRSCRDQTTNDHVLLQSAQIIPFTEDRSFCQNTRCPLERCCGDEVSRDWSAFAIPIYSS